MKAFVAGINDDGMRLSRFVQQVTHGLPQGAMHKAFRNKRIKVNGQRATPESTLAAGDEICLYLNDEYFPAAAPPHAGQPAVAPLAAQYILWEDARLAILAKPPGMLSHSDDRNAPGMLDSFTALLVQRGEYLPAAEHRFAPALCNRLDRNTEGLLAAAKQYSALRDMNALLRQRLVHKTYLCITRGVPPQGVHSAHLRRDRGAHRVEVTANAVEGSKPIQTGVRILEQSAAYCLCEVALLTGRTHQIRAHLAFLGAPLLGDRKYGGPPLPAGTTLQGQALCAYKLAFDNTLPPECGLQDLAGKTFEAPHSQTLALWHQLHP